MNRTEEYRALLEALDQNPPGLDSVLDRALQRKRRRNTRILLRPAAGLAACFALFVLLVNVSAPLAHACSQVPFLRELAQAVTFSRSLSAAVDNEFVQTLGLSQAKNGITAQIDYLIVDQKQVNVFYRLDSPEYTQLTADPDVLDSEDVPVPPHSISSGSFGEENGQLLQLTIDFIHSTVPGSLNLRLEVYSNAPDLSNTPPEAAVPDMFEDTPEGPQEYLASFDFLLEFDPQFTAAGKTIPVNKTVLLEDQAITIRDIQIYPTHMRLDIGESPGNTAWLKDLDFYIETDWGMQFEPVSNGISATGSDTSPSMISYRADSSYFYEAKHLKLVITGAKWLRKDWESTYLNLVTGETGPLPQGVAFDSARRSGTGWVVTFRADLEPGKPMHQLFGGTFRDAGGKEYETNMWSSTIGDRNEAGEATCFFDSFPLKNYPHEEVWLKPMYSHFWAPEDEIVISIQ